MRAIQGLLRHTRLGKYFQSGTQQSILRSTTSTPLVDFTSNFLSSTAPKKTSHQSFGIREFSSQTELLDILAREHDEEVSTGNVEMPQELADLKSSLEASWYVSSPFWLSIGMLFIICPCVVSNTLCFVGFRRMVDEGASTKLFLKDKKVQISFHCQDTVEEVVYDENEEYQDEEPILPLRFTVTVSKAGKKLVLECMSELGQAKVVGVSTASSDSAEENMYQGPDFFELAEDLQESFAIYLDEECAVTSDVATFVAMYADYKEQMQYVQFLKDAKSIIE